MRGRNRSALEAIDAALEAFGIDGPNDGLPTTPKPGPGGRHGVQPFCPIPDALELIDLGAVPEHDA